MEKIINPFFSGILHSDECKASNHQSILNYINTCWSHYPRKEYGVVFTGDHNNDFTSALELDSLFNELCGIILNKADEFYESNLKSIDIKHITKKGAHDASSIFNKRYSLWTYRSVSLYKQRRFKDATMD